LSAKDRLFTGKTQAAQNNTNHGQTANKKSRQDTNHGQTANKKSRQGAIEPATLQKFENSLLIKRAPERSFL
jgi:hypothetical protein